MFKAGLETEGNGKRWQ